MESAVRWWRGLSWSSHLLLVSAWRLTAPDAVELVWYLLTHCFLNRGCETVRNAWTFSGASQKSRTGTLLHRQMKSTESSSAAESNPSNHVLLYICVSTVGTPGAFHAKAVITNLSPHGNKVFHILQTGFLLICFIWKVPGLSLRDRLGAWEFLPELLKNISRREMSRILCSAWHHDLAPDKQKRMNGWIHAWSCPLKDCISGRM